MSRGTEGIRKALRYHASFVGFDGEWTQERQRPARNYLRHPIDLRCPENEMVIKLTQRSGTTQLLTSLNMRYSLDLISSQSATFFLADRKSSFISKGDISKQSKSLDGHEFRSSSRGRFSSPKSLSSPWEWRGSNPSRVAEPSRYTHLTKTITSVRIFVPINYSLEEPSGVIIHVRGGCLKRTEKLRRP